MCRTPVLSPITGSSCSTSSRAIRDQGAGRLRIVTAALAAFVVAGASTPLCGQTGNPDSAAAQSSLSPTIGLTAGWDDNVFRVNTADNPIGDFTTTISPDVQASLRMSRLRVSGRAEVDFIHFRKVSQINSIDILSTGRVELPLGRLTPYFGGDWTNTRHRRNFEIDLPIRQVDSSWNAGVDLRLSGKTSIGVMRRAVACGLQGRHELPRQRSRTISRCDGGDHRREVSVFLDALHYHRSRRRAGPN